jgi:hypothetical protein
MPKYIYYDGIGAKKSGKHTEKEFLNIMNKKYNTWCTSVIANKEFKPCTQYQKMNIALYDHIAKYKNFNYTRSKKSEKKYKGLVKKCIKFKKTFTRKCNIDEYIDFSGASRTNI